VALLLAGVTATGLVLGNAPMTGTIASRAFLSMKLDRLPGEGDPFNEGLMRRAEDIAVPTPRDLVDATVLKPQYIETEDEPWHATCRASSVVTKADFDAGFAAALPFAAAEDALDAGLATAADADAVDALVKACLASGGRVGCPAIEASEKLKKNMAAAAKDGKPAPKYKPIKPPTGGATPGFKNQGEGRALAKVHDNSV